ncbi:MAG TPA: transaldolase [Steroidobacteraceae bacterium]
MSSNPLRLLRQLGQSVWLDHIERGLILGGGLARLIEEDGVSGLTSNPAIFQKAFAGHEVYRASIESMARAGRKAEEVHEALIIEDIQAAADVLAPVYRDTQGRDGFVSLEVSPHLARDTEGTCSEAKRLWARVGRENLMIKVPGTIEGIEAVRRLTADGVNVNITLLFSVERYEAVAEAFMAGLEERLSRDLGIERIACVASFFLSRIDTLVDQRLEAVDDPEVKRLRGECAIACAREAYRRYRAIIASDRWRALEARGARSQRLLWASTSTKNPEYSDVKYVEALIGPDTITTVPPETLSAYRDHGDPKVRLTEPGPTLATIVEALTAAGIDWSAVAPQLEADGIRKFIEPHEAALAALRKRIDTLTR